jgi:ppGpp synthetase/RelA/SpoT-type nucleotidyltranferase
MRLPFTKSQVEKLGVRLISTPKVESDALNDLHTLLGAYSEALKETADRVRGELGVPATARVKNTGTILEKLDRYGGSWLKSIQDLAGMRIVGDFDRDGQDVLVARIVDLFSEEKRPPKIVDRRAAPVHGYRAVHVVVFPDGIPIEVQVRTRRQHEWAELFEKLADRLGRGIRYGEPPAHWLSEAERAVGSDKLRATYESEFAVREQEVELATRLADLIAALEQAECAIPDEPEVVALRRSVDEAMTAFQKLLDVYNVQPDLWRDPQ